MLSVNKQIGKLDNWHKQIKMISSLSTYLFSEGYSSSVTNVQSWTNSVAIYIRKVVSWSIFHCKLYKFINSIQIEQEVSSYHRFLLES
jgi:hypothetical protein